MEAAALGGPRARARAVPPHQPGGGARGRGGGAAAGDCQLSAEGGIEVTVQSVHSTLHSIVFCILNIASMSAVSPPLGEVSAGLVVAAEVAQLPAAQRHHVQEVELHQRGAPGPHLASI